MTDLQNDPWQQGTFAPPTVPPPPPAPPLMPPPPPAMDEMTRLRGVKGWLLFFCVTLVLIYPGARMYELTQVVPVYSRLFSAFPGLFLLTLFLVAMNVAIAGLSVYAGVLLLRVRPGAVRTTKRFLIAAAVYVVLVSFAPLLAGLPQAANDIVLKAAVSSIGSGMVYVAIWFSYLTSSKRVRATYPAPSTPAFPPPPPVDGVWPVR